MKQLLQHIKNQNFILSQLTKPGFIDLKTLSLKKWIDECHITNSELAEVLGVSRITIHAYRRGRQNPIKKTFDKIVKLSEGFIHSFEQMKDDYGS